MVWVFEEFFGATRSDSSARPLLFMEMGFHGLDRSSSTSMSSAWMWNPCGSNGWMDCPTVRLIWGWKVTGAHDNFAVAKNLWIMRGRYGVGSEIVDFWANRKSLLPCKERCLIKSWKHYSNFRQWRWRFVARPECYGMAVINGGAWNMQMFMLIHSFSIKFIALLFKLWIDNNYWYNSIKFNLGQGW